MEPDDEEVKIPPDVIIPDETSPIKAHHDVALKIMGIRSLEKRVALLREQRDSAVQFYEDRIAKEEDRINFLKTYIQTYLETSGIKSMPTFAGSVALSQRITHEWDDNTIIAWAEKNAPDIFATERIIQKTKIKEWETKNDKLFPGHTIKQKPSITITKPRQANADPDT